MTLALAVILTLAAAPAFAQDALELADEVMLPGGGEQTFTFEAPDVPDGLIAVLAFRGRIVRDEGTAGHTPGVQVFLNDTELTGRRLVNKSEDLTWGAGRVGTWWSRGFRLMYSPDFEANNDPENPYYIHGGKAYTFELNVHDLLQPGENTLRLKHPQADPEFRPAQIVDLRIIAREPAETEPGDPGPPTGPLPFIAPERDHREQFTVNCAPGGGILVTVGGREYALDSSFSHERGGWNALSASQEPTGEDGAWSVQVGIAEGGFAVTAQAADYRIERLVTVHDEYIEVADTVTNTSGRDIALLQRHETDADPDELQDLYLAGLHPGSKTGVMYEPSNPTVLLIHEGSQMGLMPHDDVLRVHSRIRSMDGRAGIRDDDGALAAGASETYRWEIFPSETTGYYEMVNAVRRAHDVNFEIPGGFAFINPREPFLSMSDEELAAWLDAKNAQIVGISISVPKYKGRPTHGTAFLQVDHTAKKEFAERIRRIRPGTKVLVYFHCFLDVTDDAPERFPECRTLGPDGVQRTYTSDREYLRHFFPTEENAYGEQMEEFVRIILEEIGADGVYWDEISQSRWAYHYGEPWDGRSADVNAETLQITRKKASVSLISLRFRRALVQDILDRSMMIGNGSPNTRTMTEPHFPRFIETGSVSNLLRGQLYTPIGLGDHLSERTTQDCVDGMRRHLDYGGVYYFYHDQVPVDYPSITERMFPCTPLELHEGYILAQERILTNTSGNFGWGDDAEFEVYVYGPDGREVEDFAAPVVEREGARYVQLRLPRDYMAAIVRK